MPRKISARNRSIASNGYVLIWNPNHPMADIRGYIYEHRLILAEKIGRQLKNGEQVHHIDGNKRNNHPDNLELIESFATHRLKHRKPESVLRLPGQDNPLISCACGCGERFNKFDYLGRPRLFVSGHNMRKTNG